LQVPAHIRSAFEQVDTNRSGKLDTRELQIALRTLGVDADSIATRRVVDRFDRDGDRVR